MSATAADVDSRTAAVVDAIRAARARKAALRIRGAGTWLRAGRPVAPAETLSLSDDRGIVEYVPGDLTLTARAGTPIADIARETGRHGQWLPLDPWGGDTGSLGATVSTATAGPHAYAMGLPRDVVLGVEMVSGGGRVIRAGGRVVKNVAGFDLTRLVVGSWGTLGVITEVTVRLRARPEHTRTLALDAPPGHPQMNDLAQRLRAMPFAPLACELLQARLASQLGVGGADRDTLLVQCGGNRRAVDAQVESLAGLGTARDATDDVWGMLRTIDASAAASWRLSQLPSVFAQTWSAADRATRAFADSLLHGSPLRGVVRVVVPGEHAQAAELARAAATFQGTVAIECLPENAWSHVELRPAQDPISRAIRATFDPDGVLNPGILGGDA